MNIHTHTHTHTHTQTHKPTDDDVDLSDYDPNIVASLLKQYLRELPEPLISSVRFESAASESKNLLCTLL